MDPRIYFTDKFSFLIFKMKQLINILSLNVGMSNTLAGITNLISSNRIDLILLQEVRLSAEQLDNILAPLDFASLVNVDLDSPSIPGTAIAWKNSLPVDKASNLVDCRLQMVQLGPYNIFNTYGPSGSNKRHERSVFFSREVFQAFSLFPSYSWWRF